MTGGLRKKLSSIVEMEVALSAIDPLARQRASCPALRNRTAARFRGARRVVSRAACHPPKAGPDAMNRIAFCILTAAGDGGDAGGGGDDGDGYNGVLEDAVDTRDGRAVAGRLAFRPAPKSTPLLTPPRA